MPLRCLLFSSNEEMVRPIWQVLSDLGIEGEYCKNAVDAVEHVTTQLFQIVITDWEDQPEATFLLKTVRDLRAAQRPLTLAIVDSDSRMPEALQAGANSVLVKPIRVSQVRDTLTTACELLKSKLRPAASSSAPVSQSPAPGPVPAGAASAAAAAPARITQVPEQSFRAEEFLQAAPSAPGGQFDTDSDIEKSMQQATASEVEALTELEPMAAAVKDVPAPPAPLPAPAGRLTGWASLQSRLNTSQPPAAPARVAAPVKSELLAYEETESYSAPDEDRENNNKKTSQKEAEAEAALFAYMSGDAKEAAQPVEPPRPKRAGIFLIVPLALGCFVLVALPQTRESLFKLYRGAAHAGRAWLTPPPAPVQAAVKQHESFGQAGDEYKFPVATSIPDATTDPSQIRVVPVIDPTAKPAKGAAANNVQPQANVIDNNPIDPNQSGQNSSGQTQNDPQRAENGASQTPADSAANATAPAQAAIQAQPVPVISIPARPPATAVQNPKAATGVSAGNSAPIPSSLKSQMGSMTPEASGTKPVEAAMSSIEPVTLPESVVWGLLTQSVDPIYPDAARSSSQKGSVILQVLIARDGTVQEAKFLQGSFVFARAAIVAVKQWHFKPYLLNGRPVSVQSSVTLNFKPPA
jgi:TonB family protein